MSPCNGIAVMTAETQVDLQAHFQDAANRDSFRKWLIEQGIDAKEWWQKRTPQGMTWALGVETDWIGLAFVGSTIEMSNERQRDFDRYRQELDAAYFHTQLYAGMLAQQQVLEAFVAMGIEVQDLAYDDNGSLVFNIELGA